MAKTPVFSKQMLVEDVVNHNRNTDFRNSIFLRGNGDFFKSDGDKALSAHLKSINMEDQAHKFELRYFNDYSVNNKTQKGYILALKDPTADYANDLMDTYLQARKNYVDSRVKTSNEYRLKAIDDVRQASPNAFVGLPGKEFFSDPLTISKIGRNDLLKDQIESRPISGEIRSYEYTNDGTDSLLESRVALYEIYPKPDSNLSKEAMITAIHSIYDIVEQNQEAQKEFDQTIQEQSFTQDDGMASFSQEDFDYMNRADPDDQLIDIGQNAPSSFAQETGFDSKDYGEPVNEKDTESPVQNLQDKPSDGEKPNPSAKKDPKFKQNAPKVKDFQLDNLIGDLATKEEQQKDRNDPDDEKDSKGKKSKAKSEPESARIAEMLVQAMAKLIEIILMVLKMILAMIMAAFTKQSVLGAAKDVYTDFKNKPNARGGVGDLENKKSLENSLDNAGISNTIANGFTAGLNGNNPKVGNVAALDSVGNNSPPRATDLDLPFEQSPTTALIQLPSERMEELKLLGFSPEEIKELSSKIEVQKEHKIADGLADVPPEFGYSLEHGASLSVTDTVKNADGVEGSVLGGFQNDGKMYYAVASKDAEGNFEINSHPASDLTVIGYGNSELKDNPELIEKLYKDQFTSVLAETPTARDFKIPTPWSDTHFPWDSDKKSTIASLAEQGVPVVKGIKDIDLTNVKPFDEIKAEITEKVKDNIYIAAMHTNKTAEMREKVNAHPLYGELLNINDKVDVNLPKSDRLSTGAVVGAYVNNDGDLKYQVKLPDGLITNIKAENVAVVGYDQGGLTKGAIKTYAAGLPTGSKLNAGEKVNNGSTILLSHEHTDSYANDFFVKSREVIAQKLPNLISGNQALDANGNQQDVGRVISRINDNNKTEKYVTVGRFIKNIDGVDRDVYMAMPAMTNPVTFNTARNKHFLDDKPKFFAVDDPSIKIEANGITSAHLKNVIEKVSNFIHENIDKGKNDHIHKMSVMAHTTQDALLEQIHHDREIEKQELNVKSALAYQTLYQAEPELSQEINSNIEDVVDQTKQIEDQFQNVVNSASPRALESLLQIDPSVGATQHPKDIEKSGELYQGVDHSDLTLVRVQRGIDGIQSNGSNLILNHDMNNPDSVRNTMHFALNGSVTDHAYGTFNDANFVLISNLKQTAQENEISGLSPADTWFHSKDNKIVLPNATLIALENAEIPAELENGNIKIVRFSEGDTPEQTLSNRNDAISNELQARNVPQFELNMHNWAGHSLTNEDQLVISSALGKSKLPTNHSLSVDGELEGRFATMQSLKESLANGEKEYQNFNNGQWYPLAETIKSNEDYIKQLIEDMPDSQAKTFYNKKLDERIDNSELAAADIESSDFSAMTIPDNSEFIAQQADDLQDQFISTSDASADLENQHNHAFDGPPLDSYQDDLNRSFDNSVADNQFEDPFAQEQTFNQEFNVNQEVSQPPIGVDNDSFEAEPNVPIESEIKFNALGYIESINIVNDIPLQSTGYAELDTQLDNLKSMAINEPNDDPIVYVVNEVREELLGLQNSTLIAGHELFSHPSIKDDVDQIKKLSSITDGTLIAFDDSDIQTTYPNIAQIKQLSAIGNMPEEAKDAVEKLLVKMANDPEIKPLVQNYIEHSESLSNYASTYTSEMSKFVSKTVEHEGFRSGYMGKEQQDLATASIDQIKNEGSMLLDAIGNSQKNASFINASSNDADNDVGNLLTARTLANSTNELKNSFINDLTASGNHVINPRENTRKQDQSNENTI